MSKINLFDGNDEWRLRDEGNTLSEYFDYEIVWDLSDLTDLGPSQEEDYSKIKYIRWDLDGGEFEEGKTNPELYSRVDEFELNNPVKEDYVLFIN